MNTKKKQRHKKYLPHITMDDAQDIVRQYLCSETSLNNIAEKFNITKEEVLLTIKLYIEGRNELKILFANKTHKISILKDNYETNLLQKNIDKRQSFKDFYKDEITEYCTVIKKSKV
jgi:hypothetical protein